MTNPQVSYLVFDVETIADGELISRTKYSDENLTGDEAAARYREELMAKFGRDVLPPTWVLPTSVCIAKVASDFRLLDIVALDAPQYRPFEMAKMFWQGWEHYRRPAFVTFNGRGYDMPVMELAAFRYGISIPAWFNVKSKSFEQSRNRYNIDRHIDLQDFFSNFSAMRVSGGLNMLANLIGKPGKSGVDGSQVQQMYDDGQIEEINDYCRCDVLDTYFVFLRSRVLTGELSLNDEQQIIDEVHAWLEERAGQSPAYAHYLENWGDWEAPALVLKSEEE
ncbi:MAG: 3'-5' exonuclease [Planctomycetaceae bacterium]